MQEVVKKIDPVAYVTPQSRFEWENLLFPVVEAAGVEPASAKRSFEVSTCVESC